VSNSPVTTAVVISGQGDKGGRQDADINNSPIMVTYSASNAPANCVQAATVECTVMANNATKIVVGGNRVPAAEGDVTCMATKASALPGEVIKIGFRSTDNDTERMCLEGSVTFKLALRSSADGTKASASQTFTANLKNNCYPEISSTALTGSLDAFDQLGSVVAIDGNTAAVLAPGDDGANNSVSNIGAVYIFRKNAAQAWVLSQTLRTDETSIVSDRGAAGDSPASMALKNGYLAVGSEFRDGSRGAVYVFRDNGSSFVSHRTFLGPVAAGKFGKSVAVDGTQLAVGAPAESSSAGAVYVYDLASGAQTARLASPLNANSYFGAAVAIESSLLAVGAPGSTLYRETMSGALVLFQNSGGSWAEVSNVLRSSTLPLGSEIGASLSILGGKVLVGAPGFSVGARKHGAAYLIGADRSQIEDTFKDFSNTEGGRFGTSVSLAASSVAIGVPEVRTRAGAVDLFSLNGGKYVFSRRLVSLSGAASDQFGYSVSQAGSQLVVGARVNAEPNNSSGSASFILMQVP